MASETSELTFVRCPTCRSLVPATASRCRICNATLEAGGKPAAGDAQAAGGRGRQKTVAASPEEIANIVAASTPPPPPAPAAPLQQSPQPAQPESPIDDGFDPLGAFLQDLDSSPESAPSPTTSAPAAVSQEDDLDDFDLDLFDEPSFDETPTKVVVEPLEPEPSVVDEDPLFDDTPPPPPPVVPEARVEVKQPESVAPVEVSVKPTPPQSAKVEERFARQEQPRQARQEQRIVRDTPPPRSNQPMRPKVAQPQSAPPRQEAKPAREEAPRRDRPQQQPPGNRSGAVRDNQSARPQGGHKPVQHGGAHKQQQPQHQHNNEKHNGRRHDERDTRHDQGAHAQRPGRVPPGRLFGWLVSFENPDGRAIELRGGRFFITGTSIRDSDLILEDQSISTPHALMAITDRGLMIQDLMSERGTFIRSQGDSQYRREESAVELRHGDWLRFGDVEFLVTIVPMKD